MQHANQCPNTAPTAQCTCRLIATQDAFELMPHREIEEACRSQGNSNGLQPGCILG